MKNTTNRRSHFCTENKIEFKASNLQGIWKDNCYQVISYKWYPIFVWDWGKWYENKEGYSPSTKRQISNSRPCANTILVSHDEIKEIIKKCYHPNDEIYA